jgi:phage tail sheath protein FI
VRRLLMMIEGSIVQGTQWVVFEPNNEPLWARLRGDIEEFLFGLWRAGALAGNKPEQAFFVRCDRSTMTQNDLDNGRVICQIGIAVIRPAEFMSLRIGWSVGE